ncbi:MAG TPA: NAD-dependent epimerase/dehydratase family protein [Thermoleophilia bacterium]|nr:NAD-dependent epimerase/dehydratase family protein [Thermoleophilia bacterium]
MNILIAGIDGYIGWALAHRLHSRGHKIVGIDNGSRRAFVARMESASAVPILSFDHRKSGPFELIDLDISGHAAIDGKALAEIFRGRSWDAVVNLAHQPSAAWSMRSLEDAIHTSENNTSGMLALLWALRKDYDPRVHLLTLGTMGEYGTPNIEITEGPIEVEFRGRRDKLPFPRRPGSIYHATKCAMSLYVDQACRFWGLRATDVMQGVVYGSRGEWDAPTEAAQTRVDFDECFGTVIHRFCAQAVAGVPLTVYGEGGQTRGYLPLRDSLTCLVLALESPPGPGEYRVFNQFDRCYSVSNIAEVVISEALNMGLNPTWENVPNPRVESEDHYYQPESLALRKLGYEPTGCLAEDVRQILDDMIPHRERIARLIRPPQIAWR